MVSIRCCYLYSRCGGGRCDPRHPGWFFGRWSRQIWPLGGNRVPRVLGTALSLGWALAPLGGQAMARGSRCQGHPALDRPEGGPPCPTLAPWACAIEVPQTQPSALPATVPSASLRPSPVPGSSCHAPNCANSGPCRLGAAPSPRHPAAHEEGWQGVHGRSNLIPIPAGHSELSAPPSGVRPSEVHTQRPRV